ncbi:MAG: hypothetical protein FJX72_17070, partial [Armatimonadetes bacterium]|nr:hypothetical protein [Armatimonadota bacterium]
MTATLLLALALTAPPGRAGSFSVIRAGADGPMLASTGSSRVERRTATTGLRILDVAVRSVPARMPRPTNLCLNRARKGFPAPSSNSSEPSYGDCVWSAIDGVPWEGDYEWSSDYRNPAVPRFEVAFGKVVRVDSVRLWLRRGYELRDFDVMVRLASGKWETVGTARGNREEMRAFRFPARSVTAVGVECLSGPDIQPTIRRITEIEAFGPEPAPPAGTSGFSYRIDLPAGKQRYLDIREAYGEGETLREVEYEVRLDGRAVHQRVHRCDGPGPISYAVPIPAGAARRSVLSFVDTRGYGLSIARVRALSDPVGIAERKGLSGPMLIAPRLEIRPPYTQPEPDRALAAWVAAAEPARAFVRPGLLAIVGYATPDAAAVEAKIRAYAELAQRHRTPWVLQLSSWWADTPLRVPDGLGGTFGDIRYQQIGYSQHDNYHDPGLKEFMDAVSPGTYSVHYGLTVPNLWSNTPWLTMNDERLNAFKVDCLGKAVGAVNRVKAEPGGELLQAIVTDDEPIYWTRITDWMEQGYGSVNGGVRRTDLILDVNPSVVRDAAREGVTLDPTDGLSDRERQWLHRNNARYVAMKCRAIRDALAPGSPLRERIFNYLLAQPLYPLDDYGHPGWEIGMVPGAAIGLEAFDGRYFTRARDLGPLANSDFECANPSADQTRAWEPNFGAWHDAGCSFVQLCNPGPADRWVGLFEAIGKWDLAARRTERALSALVQE